MTMKPFKTLDENGNVPKPVPLWWKIVLFPVVLVLLVIVWPWVWWSEHRRR